HRAVECRGGLRGSGVGLVRRARVAACGGVVAGQADGVVLDRDAGIDALVLRGCCILGVDCAAQCEQGKTEGQGGGAGHGAGACDCGVSRSVSLARCAAASCASMSRLTDVSTTASSCPTCLSSCR